MKILIAPDAFKHSLSAAEAAQAMACGIRAVLPNAELILKPMADGGEGTLDVLLAATGAAPRQSTVQDPLGRNISARWGWLAESQTALLELAEACGLMRLKPGERDACHASSFGCGELIRAALDAGARHIILGIGGSACVDGGSGLLQALGARLLTAQGKPIAQGGAGLAELAHIHLADLDARLKQVTIEVLCDVDNPLCGAQGAATVFAPQKGANAEQVARLEAALSHFAELTESVLGEDFSIRPGSGAAGGAGFALQAFLSAKIVPGAAKTAEIIHLDKAMQHCDLVISGEGCLDAQTLHGKTLSGVLQIARRQQIPVIALAGSLGEGYQALYHQGLTAAFSLVSGPLSLEQACQNAAQLLHQRTQDIVRLLSLFKAS
ncbi:glycerate kinase [Ventosimonas gracilis]|uniref:Glycerate kinase n=1 Tax=Ventosimonas gracilis TaxID=1680762 RepID=A0A139SX23_9GAMM|nr:glycerate kinase [Ventosimonas gracilis]KXU39175.1 glycerate kinase [Ventosimonas gracilis]